MKRMILLAAVALLLTLPVQAMDFQAPQAPEAVRNIVPQEADSFAQGLWNVVKAAIDKINPSLAEAGRVCMRVICVVLLGSIVSAFCQSPQQKAVELACSVAVGLTLLEPSASLIRLGQETVQSLSEYGKLLLPVMTGALAAQGGSSTSTALYVLTAFFDSLLSSVISRLLLPMVYIYLALSIANAALNEKLLQRLRDGVKWTATWTLKIILYVFTGLISVTGVVSGAADAAAVKAAKITISGAVPVVGGILSDASEAVLAGIGMLRSGVGIYGLLTIAALFLSPFLKTGVQYLLLKATAAVSAAFDANNTSALIGDFATALGFLQAMTGTQTLMLLISTVCFMKGVG